MKMLKRKSIKSIKYNKLKNNKLNTMKVKNNKITKKKYRNSKLQKGGHYNEPFAKSYNFIKVNEITKQGEKGEAQNINVFSTCIFIPKNFSNEYKKILYFQGFHKLVTTFQQRAAKLKSKTDEDWELHIFIDKSLLNGDISMYEFKEEDDLNQLKGLIKLYRALINLIIQSSLTPDIKYKDIRIFECEVDFEGNKYGDGSMGYPSTFGTIFRFIPLIKKYGPAEVKKIFFINGSHAVTDHMVTLIENLKKFNTHICTALYDFSGQKKLIEDFNSSFSTKIHYNKNIRPLAGMFYFDLSKKENLDLDYVYGIIKELFEIGQNNLFKYGIDEILLCLMIKKINLKIDLRSFKEGEQLTLGDGKQDGSINFFPLIFGNLKHNSIIGTPETLDLEEHRIVNFVNSSIEYHKYCSKKIMEKYSRGLEILESDSLLDVNSYYKAFFFNVNDITSEEHVPIISFQKYIDQDYEDEDGCIVEVGDELKTRDLALLNQFNTIFKNKKAQEYFKFFTYVVNESSSEYQLIKELDIHYARNT